jgi:hypothetical protein
MHENSQASEMTTPSSRELPVASTSSQDSVTLAQLTPVLTTLIAAIQQNPSLLSQLTAVAPTPHPTLPPTPAPAVNSSARPGLPETPQTPINRVISAGGATANPVTPITTAEAVAAVREFLASDRRIRPIRVAIKMRIRDKIREIRRNVEDDPQNQGRAIGRLITYTEYYNKAAGKN